MKALRLYVFDNGAINGLDPKLFGFERSQVKEPDFTVQSYFVVHPRGTLMFDAGAIPDGDFKGPGPVIEGVVTATTPLLPQLAAAGYPRQTSLSSRCRTTTPTTRPTPTPSPGRRGLSRKPSAT